jgi:hypothetical protein
MSPTHHGDAMPSRIKMQKSVSDSSPLSRGGSGAGSRDQPRADRNFIEAKDKDNEGEQQQGGGAEEETAAPSSLAAAKALLRRKLTQRKLEEDDTGEGLTALEHRFLRAVSYNKVAEVTQCIREKVNVNVKNSFQR